jgi:hypothetical protein
MIVFVTWGGGILCGDVITHPDALPTRSLLTPDNSDVTNTIYEIQGPNSGENA